MPDTSHIRFIAIEGIIRRDSTTLARTLSGHIDARPVLDEMSASPMIDFNSSDPGDYLLKKHVLRLIDRYKTQKQLWQTEMFHDCVVADYLFYADRIHATLKLPAEDLAIYDVLMDHMEKDIVVPDVIVYLQSNPERILEKLHASYDIKKGARRREVFDEEYILQLNNEFNQFFLHFAWCPVLIVNANQLDGGDRIQTEALWSRIQKHTAGIGFYNPAGSTGDRLL